MGQSLGAGPVPHGRAARDRGRVRVHRGGGGPAPRVGARPARRDPPRRRHRNARRPFDEQPPRQPDQRGRDSPPAGALGAAPLRLPERRRGGEAEGAGRPRGRRDRAGRADGGARAAQGVHVSLETQLLLLAWGTLVRSEEHTSELQSHSDLVCRLLLEKKTTGSPSEVKARSMVWAPSSHITCEAMSSRGMHCLARYSNWARAWRKVAFGTTALTSAIAM